jgi:Fe-S-cluster-containing dehydrogenase component
VARKAAPPGRSMKPDSMERRLFLSYGLKITGVFLCGQLLSLTSVRKVQGALQGVAVIGNYPYTPHYAMVVRQDKCIGCRQCLKVCRSVNSVPSYGYRNAVLERGNPADENIEFLPVVCNQCNRPPCVKVCPTKATYKDKKNGIVMMDDRLCIGCEACMTACPYNARYYNDEHKAVDKCDFCFKTRLAGKTGEPACVAICPTKVFVFGDLNDKDTEVYKTVHSSDTTLWVLRPERGTMPNVFYITEEHGRLAGLASLAAGLPSRNR